MASVTQARSAPPSAKRAPPCPAYQILPPTSPLAMPVQSLAQGPRAGDRRLQGGMAWRRAVLLGLTGGLTLAGASVMGRLLAAGGFSLVDAATLALFAVLFGWVAFAFVSAMAGFVVIRRAGTRAEWRPQPIVFTRTALLLPTYNEDPGRILAAVQAIYEDLQRLEVLEMYDLFVLSDTRDPAVARDEVAGVLRLRLRLSAQQRIFYRRRAANTDRKAGNIADWVARFGGAYESMIILDADSLMGGETIVGLTAAMERQPDTGLIQTLPVIIGARTRFARMQQFAGRLYGRMIAVGQDWWSGAEGNYWGHNAIIRTRAFAAQAGLPHIQGGKAFSGHILSHDFVEAALLRRGGWAVRMAPELDASYEETPPSLIDMAVRDRRWCQGNLQHAAVLGACGLHWVSRLHLVRGVLSYLTAPLWLAFLLLGAGVRLQGAASQPGAAALAGGLFAATLGLLLAPKLMSAALEARGGAVRRACGGGWTIALGVLAETLLSALLAPVMMLMHSRAVAEVLAGRDAGWSTQQRDEDGLSLRDAWRRHRLHTLAGLACLVGAWAIDPIFLAWSSPVILGLVLSVPLSMFTARTGGPTGLFRTPEEAAPPAIVARAAALRAAYAAEAPIRAEIARLFREHVPVHTPRVYGQRVLAHQE